MKTFGASDQRSESGQGDRLSDLSTKDLARFLRELSALLNNFQTGNPALGSALGQLAKVIQRHSSVSLSELLPGIIYAPNARKPKARSPSTYLAGLDLASLELDRVKQLISQKQLTKEDLIHIASNRFGIPSSGLRRQTRSAVLEAVGMALRNEESIAIISREANRQGLLRST